MTDHRFPMLALVGPLALVGLLASAGGACVGRWCLGRQEPLGAAVSVVSLLAMWFSCYIQENHVAWPTATAQPQHGL